MNLNPRRDLNELKGKIPVIIRYMKEGSEVVDIFFSDLTHLKLLHYDDCCERVQLVDVAGDPKDLIGRALAICEETTSVSESGTVTWYKFVTMEGSVTLRWLGQSNGFYSESVDVEIETLDNLTCLSDEELVEWDRVQEQIESPSGRCSWVEA